jgi:LuxR family transcriptional regulator, maltose regulon positive regulatory protein
MGMPAPLLETKLYVPGPRPGRVARPRLVELLDHGAASKLTLVSAPAGFGKTTVLADWLAGRTAGASDGNPAAWLSLDQGDNDALSFWTGVVSALRSVRPDVGTTALASLNEPQPPPIRSVLTRLLNELGAMEADIVLVLDDYHVIDAIDVHDAMAYLVDHLPARSHLVIATRADPPLPLARLRARSELVEIRAADLRFTSDEAAAYLNESMGLDLTAGDVAALEGRTEGWIAALQLAALSMQGRDDVAGFIAGFAGDDRYIVDFLVEEVLQRQPAELQTFLLQTSVLDRLSGPLCDAVSGREGGRAILEALERGNLFLVPLDDRRRWYRYHHLFADVLRARVLDEFPGQVPDLHRRASAWYEQNGEPSAAIRHALAAGDFEHAADLVERATQAMRRRRQDATLRGWLEMLPDDVVRVRPVLSVNYAGALLGYGELEGVEARLQDAERWLDERPAQAEGPGSPSARTVVDPQELRRLPGAIAVYRAGQALIRGDVPGTMRHASRALELTVDDDHLERAAAAGLVGLALWGSGDLESAHRSYSECASRLLQAGFVTDTLGCAIAMADIRLAQGRLGEARSTYERALQRAGEEGGPVLRGTADMYVGLSEIDRERDELTAARRRLLRSQELGEHTGLPQNPYRWRVAMARVLASEGDLVGAVDLLDEADHLYVGDFFPNVRPVPALRARMWVAQGRLSEARRWARERGLSADDDLEYVHEFEHLTLARLLLARHRSDRTGGLIGEVTGLLERLLRAAEGGNRSGSVSEILVLQALAHQQGGDSPAALTSLQGALRLSEPEGYVRLFVDEGAPMLALLGAVSKHEFPAGYVRRLIAAFGERADKAPALPGLVEPLSERELDVLRLLGSDLNGPDIARELIVSLNTVRTHTKSIYAKLGVNNRRAAVRRAAELRVSSRSRGRSAPSD